MKGCQRLALLLLALPLVGSSAGCNRSSAPRSVRIAEEAAQKVFQAIQNDDFDTIKQLATEGNGWQPLLDPDTKLGYWGVRYFFPVHLAAVKGSQSVLQELLCSEVRHELERRGELGAGRVANDLEGLMRFGRLPIAGPSLDARDEKGRTPAMWLCDYHDPNILKAQLGCLRLLARAGANLEAKDAIHGATALHHAVASADADVVIELLSLGTNVDSRNRVGNSPLHEACALAAGENMRLIVRLLTEAGADASAKNLKGKTPGDTAIENGHVNVMPILKGAEGKRPKQ